MVSQEKAERIQELISGLIDSKIAEMEAKRLQSDPMIPRNMSEAIYEVELDERHAIEKAEKDLIEEIADIISRIE